MKSSTKNLNIVVVLLASLILTQGCTAYKSIPVSLEEASLSKTKTKIKTKFNKKFHFQSIVFEDGNYYGINTVKEEMVKIRIDENSLDKVLIKSDQKSTIYTIAAPLILIGLVFLTASHRFKNHTVNN